MTRRFFGGTDDMTPETAISLAYPLGLGLAALGSALGLGRAVAAAMEAMGRQPDRIPQIQLAMIIGCAFIEALAIYALISVFLA
jgi:F-type H+-transporting ATPase subunit c